MNGPQHGSSVRGGCSLDAELAPIGLAAEHPLAGHLVPAGPKQQFLVLERINFRGGTVQGNRMDHAQYQSLQSLPFPPPPPPLPNICPACLCSSAF